MHTPIFHYIYDPLCGWCYGAAPLLACVHELDNVTLTLHGGGLMSGRSVTAELRRFVMANDARIGKISGQRFGQDYVDGLLLDETAVFDSVPPIAAILAAQACGADGYAMLVALQQAHFVAGRKIVDQAVLLELAIAQGIEAGVFQQSLAQQLSGSVEQHIVASRARLAGAGGGGFPTLVLERGGQMTPLDISGYYGQVEPWRADLLAILSR